MPKVSRGRRKWGVKSDVNLDGKETLRIGTDIIEIWPKYCVRYSVQYCVRHFRCLQCHYEGKIQCAPRFREKHD